MINVKTKTNGFFLFQVNDRLKQLPALSQLLPRYLTELSQLPGLLSNGAIPSYWLVI